MHFRSLSLATTLLFAAALAPLSAQSIEAAEPRHFVFVLHGAKDFAEVFDGSTMTRLGSPRVGFGAFRAFGLPGSNDTGAAAKFYILTPRAVRVLDGGFHEIDSISLSRAALAGRGGAALSSDGATLMIATVDGLYFIDTATDAVAAFAPAGVEVAGVALSSDAGRAYVVAAGRPLLRPVDVAGRALLDEVVMPPVPLESWDRSPNGVRAVGLGGDAIYAVNEAGTVRYAGAIESLLRSGAEGGDWLAGRPAAGVEKTAPARRLEATNSALFYVEEAGRLWRRSMLGGLSEMVSDARTGGAVLLGEEAGWDVSPAGGAVYVASSTGELARFSADLATPVRSVALREAGGQVEAVMPRVEQAGSLTLISATPLRVAGPTRFQVIVKAAGEAGGPQEDVPVFLSNAFPATPSVTCGIAITDAAGEALMECSLGEVAAARNVELTFSDNRGHSAPIFTVNALVPSEFEGLTLLSEVTQTINLDTEISISVLVTQNRIPLVEASVNLTLDPPSRDGALTCPRTAQTDANGEATFACKSVAVLEEAETVKFTAQDPAGNTVTGTVTVDPRAVVTSGLIKVEGDGAVIRQGQAIELVVRSIRDGVPRARTVINITVLDVIFPAALTCPLNDQTDDEGFARFTCRGGTLLGTGQQIVRVQVSDFGVLLAEPFEITVTSSVTGGGGSANILTLVSPDEIELPLNTKTPQAIQVRAINSSTGASIPNVAVHFFVPEDADITVDPLTTLTDAAGLASAAVTVGCNVNPVDVGIGLDAVTPLINVEVSPEGGELTEMNIIQGDNQNGSPGQQLNSLALVAEARDACGKLLIKEPVTWRVKPTFAASLRALVNATSASGRVSSLVTLGNYGGPFQVEVGAGDVYATFNLTVNKSASQFMAASGSGQSVPAGQVAPQPLVAQAFSGDDLGVSGVGVQWSVIEGPATIVQSQTATTGAGIAFARVRVDGTGSPRVRVQATGLGQSVTFVLNEVGGPQATPAGFTNGGSFQTGWTPGGTGAIFGVDLADGPADAPSAPFPTSLGGVTVTVNGVPAPLIFVRSGQIGLQVPFGIAAGTATVEINNNGRILTVSGVQINAVQPGIFEIGPEGMRTAAALHQDGTLIGPTSPAIPGETVQLFFTGGGPLDPGVLTNEPGPSSPLAFTTVPVVVKVAGVVQQGSVSVYAPGLITAYQVNFPLAAGTASGNQQLLLEMQGVASKSVVLPVGPSAVAAQ